jgi:hypothetical protein
VKEAGGPGDAELVVLMLCPVARLLFCLGNPERCEARRDRCSFLRPTPTPFLPSQATRTHLERVGFVHTRPDVARCCIACLARRVFYRWASPPMTLLALAQLAWSTTGPDQGPG